MSLCKSEAAFYKHLNNSKVLEGRVLSIKTQKQSVTFIGVEFFANPDAQVQSLWYTYMV
jgi:hypothetical protein